MCFYGSIGFAVQTTSTCPVCGVRESTYKAANEATQYFCKAIRCTEMPWLTPKFVMQCGLSVDR